MLCFRIKQGILEEKEGKGIFAINSVYKHVSDRKTNLKLEIRHVVDMFWLQRILEVATHKLTTNILAANYFVEKMLIDFDLFEGK